MTTADDALEFTGYGSVIDTGTLDTLERRAKDELEGDVGDDVDFTEQNADSALFWLICLFIKIHVGDIGAANFSIGDIDSDSVYGQEELWLSFYRSRRDQLRGTNLTGHVRSTRDNRSYGE